MKSRKITGILLACCALLMVAIAGLGVTMAKYVRTAPDKDGEARVAIFGVNFTWPDDSTIFKTEYKNPDNDKTTVQAKTVQNVQDDVLAPGTSGSIALTISGESEVSFTLNIQITEKYLMNNVEAKDGWSIPSADEDADNENYAPIVFNVATSTGSNFNLTHDEDNRKYTFTGDFDAGTTLNTIITITWTWAFENTTEGATEAQKAEQDRKDTAVADLIGTTSDPSYSIEVSATATQID